jgi:hypothetical protein
MNKRILRVVERGGPDDGDAGDERRAAFAAWSTITGCKFGDFRVSQGVTPDGPSIDGQRSEDGFICLSLTRGGPKFYDNRPVTLPRPEYTTTP